MSNLDELRDSVLTWAEAKGILEACDVNAQRRKFFEEATEYMWAPSDEEAKMELGDVLVTVVINAAVRGWSVDECLECALEKISKRTGKMVDGAFVKDEDLLG